MEALKDFSVFTADNQKKTVRVPADTKILILVDREGIQKVFLRSLTAFIEAGCDDSLVIGPEDLKEAT